MSNDSQSLYALAQQFKEELAGLWRFRWPAMGVAWAVLVVGCLAVSFLPDRYQASSRFFVDATSRLSPLVQGLAVETNVDAQSTYIRQMMMSRPHLTELAASPELAKYNMSADERADLVDTLRDTVNIQPVRGGEMGRGLLMEFSFEYPDKQIALFVVKSLVDSFVEEARGTNVRKANEAQTFLTTQLKDLEARLIEQETRLAEFKRQNSGSLPGQGGDFFSRLQTERDGLEKARNKLGVLLSQRDSLNGQLRGQTPLVASARSGDLLSPGQKDLDTRIRESESKLEELLLRYTERHPQVGALRSTIADLKARRQEELNALRAGGTGSGSLATSDNPLYKDLQQQISRLDVDVAAAREEVGQYERRIGELQKTIDTTPRVEAELASLNRDYGVTKSQYESMLASLQRARISESAEETGVVQFQEIEPPAVKSKPVGPKRVVMLLAVLVAALGGGGALAFGLHQMRPVFSSIPALSAQLGLPVLGVVPYINPPGAAAARADNIRFALAAMALLAFFGAALILRRWTAGLAHLITG
ncbi:MAG TPA: XrtA system polysaccharide chain length determinant [Steroidobacteraceae bacterium]|nr:XrtA system polysaccharide chain length determinant [Steroidobacteraceae bacterium]